MPRMVEVRGSSGVAEQRWIRRLQHACALLGTPPSICLFASAAPREQAPSQAVVSRQTDDRTSSPSGGRRCSCNQPARAVTLEQSVLFVCSVRLTHTVRRPCDKRQKPAAAMIHTQESSLFVAQVGEVQGCRSVRLI